MHLDFHERKSRRVSKRNQGVEEWAILRWRWPPSQGYRSKRLVIFAKCVAPDNRVDAMVTLNLMLPDALHERVQELAGKNKVSINLLVATALAEKLLMRRTEEHVAERCQNGKIC